MKHLRHHLRRAALAGLWLLASGLLAPCSSLLAQVKTVSKTISTGALLEGFTVPSGQTITFASGSAIALPDNALAIGDVSGLQTALDATDSLRKNKNRRFLRTPLAISRGSASANFTFDMEIPGPLDGFTGFRIHLLNIDSAYTVGAACYAVAPTSGSNGSALTWLPLYFNNPTFLTGPSFSAGTTNTVSVPAPLLKSASSSVQNGFGVAVSDLISVNSVARSDGGTRPLIRLRFWLNSAASLTLEDSSATMSSTLGDYAPKSAFTADATGAKATAATAAANAMTPGTGPCWFMPSVIEFISPTADVVNFVAVGDSLTRGQSSGAGAGVASWFQRGLLAASTATGIDVGACNFGQSGAYAPAIISRADTAITWARPDVLVMFPGTINSSAALMDAFIQDALSVVERARSLGIVCILPTLFPSGQTTENDAARIRANTLIKEIAANSANVFLFDAAAVVEDPAAPANILAAYDSGDDVHFNEAGYLALTAAFSTVAQAVLSEYR